MSQKKQNHTEELQVTYHREDFLSIKDPILNLRMGEKLYTGFLYLPYFVSRREFLIGVNRKKRGDLLFEITNPLPVPQIV